MGADPDVVGRTIRLNNQPVTIIGVGPEDFNGEAGAMLIDFWLSISSTPVGGPFQVANLDRRQDHWYQVKARLAPTVTVERAQAAMDALAGRLAEAFPELNEGRDITVFPYDDVRFHPESDGGRITAGIGVLMALATGLLFGIIPALRSARTDVATALRDEARGQSAGRAVSFLRGGLVALQVAVSLVLVVAAGLLARSLANAERVEPGVDADRIAVMETNLEQAGVTGGEAAVVRQLLARVNALPGFERAALTNRLPAQSGWSTTQVVDGYEPTAGTGSVELPLAIVSHGYFETMGIRVLAGRTFTADDRAETSTVVVVNETAARTFWDGNAVGGRIRPQDGDGPWRQVVGVVADVKVNDLQEPPTPMIYYSAEQSGVGEFAVVARTAGDPAALTAGLRNALRTVRASLPVTRMTTLEAHLGEALAGPRVVAALMGGFSLLALLLASLGVYAVVAFTVERRTQELGIRLALGARRSRLVGMVVGRSLGVVAIGVAAGLVLAALATRGLEGMLFGVRALDPVTFVQATLLLLVAAAAAAFVPALRAARANPVEALRTR